MRSEFSAEEWTQLVFLPLDIFTFVAGIDEEIDEQEIEVFDSQLEGATRLKNPLHRDVMRELAWVRHSSAEGPPAGDAAGGWLGSLRATANRMRYGTADAPTGAGRIMMPTGGVATTPASFDVTKDVLEAKLDAHEYEYFVASVLFSAIEVAKASGGVGPESISTEENVALGTFCAMFGVGPDVIPRHFSS